MAAYNCTRCEGKGRLNIYSNVLGGVCFKCGGSGKQASKPENPSRLFAIGAMHIETGEIINRVFNKKAKSEEKAIQMAKVQLAGSKYDPETAFIYE